jgi:hypothetical protein
MGIASTSGGGLVELGGEAEMMIMKRIANSRLPVLPARRKAQMDSLFKGSSQTVIL